MLQSLNKKYPFNDNLKTNLRSIVSVSLGIFIFLLFFQPFSIQNSDFNNRLIILATFGAITLVLLSVSRLVIPSIFTRAFSEERWNVKKEIIINLLFVICNSVAFSFFARYVGKTPITFLVVIILVIISIAAASVIVVINRIYMLKLQLEELRAQIANENIVVSPPTESEIEFESENKTEYFQLLPKQLVLIKSAGNYVEVYYLKDEKLHTKLIRNTLKDTEQLLAKHPEIIRCHRSFMVNKRHILGLQRSSDGLVLSVAHYSKSIHVSRQYALNVKQALKTK